MAVSTLYTPIRQAGNDVTLTFSAAFKILTSSDIVAYKYDADGVATRGTLNVDYTVAFDPIAETVSVTWTVAPVTGGYSLIARASDEQQGTVYPRDSALPAKATEACVDKLTLLVQELFELFSTVPAFPLTTYQPPSLKIQTPADRRALVYQDNDDGTFDIIASDFDPDAESAAAAISAAAALASQNAAATYAAAALVSQTAAAASATAAAASAAVLAASESSGAYAAKPAAPANVMYYYSTDRDSYEKWVPAAGRWFLLG